MDSKTYDQLHGINNWDGLIEPLDLSLRKLILNYGDLALAAELAFNCDYGSKYCGYSNYGKTTFFKDLMLPWAYSNYHVTCFLYTTCKISSKYSSKYSHMSRENSDCESNWAGYVAVSNDEFSNSIGRREIVVVFRGTARNYEWIEDFGEAQPVPAEPICPAVPATTGGKEATKTEPHIQDGLHTIYTASNPNSEFVKSSARMQLLLKIRELLTKYKKDKISITCAGHSLGACLSVIAATDIAANVVTPDILVSAFVFESPQVGNQAFKDKVDQLDNLKILSVINKPDAIPNWPSKKMTIFGHEATPFPDYVDVGIKLLIDSTKSPYLIKVTSDYHTLPGVLHTLSGWNGEDGVFDWVLLKRSLGGVNIQSYNLKPEYKIPTAWWAKKNKGMVLNEDGDWILEPKNPREYDIPAC